MEKNPTNNDSNVLIDSPELLSPQELQHFDNILRSIQKCSQEQNIDRKIQILRFINSLLPNEIQLRIPSLITDDYVESALYNLEMACKGRIKLKNYFLLSLWDDKLRIEYQYFWFFMFTMPTWICSCWCCRSWVDIIQIKPKSIGILLNLHIFGSN